MEVGGRLSKNADRWFLSFQDRLVLLIASFENERIWSLLSCPVQCSHEQMLFKVALGT